MKSGLILIVVFILSGWQTVQGAVIEDLFDAKIAVSNQSEKNQSNAFIQALKQVLVKVRGNRDILADTHPEGRGAIHASSHTVASPNPCTPTGSHHDWRSAYPARIQRRGRVGAPCGRRRNAGRRKQSGARRAKLRHLVAAGYRY